jgi:hypothetical protein
MLVAASLSEPHHLSAVEDRPLPEPNQLLDDPFVRMVSDTSSVGLALRDSESTL